ncbi:MAG: type II toxin-antitoxin system RelE/ParE family toxin [Lachnospiraceae bacterium]|nr:type II toxin-antitoxin system RelE/ParE family toxin [Lachnospiraceae bacterium]
MRYKVEYAPSAIRDIERVRAEVFEASKSFSITEKYIDDLMDKIEAKADFPKSGVPLYYEDGFTGYYHVSFKSCLAFYRLEKDTMLVDRVLYGKSDYIRSLHLNSFDEY